MSAKLTVAIKDNGQPILGPLCDRPVRLTPDGVAGVVHGGRVYPVHEGDFIDLADESFDKSECPKFLEPGEPMPYVFADGEDDGAGIGKWSIESNSFGNYLVFDGNEQVAERVVALMDSTGLGVRRWGVSSRAADDGYHYDWFIRLDFNGDRDECVSLVSDALSTLPEDALAEEGRTAAGDNESQLDSVLEHLDEEQAAVLVAMLLEHLRPQIDALQAQINQAATRAETAESEVEKLQDERAALRAKHTSLEKELAQERGQAVRLRDQLSQADKRIAEADRLALSYKLTASKVASNQDAAAGRERALLESMAAIKQERDEIEQRMSLAEEVARESQHKSDAYEMQNQFMSEQLEAERERCERLEVEQARAARFQSEQLSKTLPSARKRKGSVRHLLGRAWPRLVIHPDSIEVMDTDFTTLSHVFGILHSLNNGEKVPSQMWKQFGDVHEVDRHLSTGKGSALGRVYYRKLSDSRLWVFVHRKKDGKEQDRFVERIANMDPRKAENDAF